jgi:hypothetical protein
VSAPSLQQTLESVRAGRAIERALRVLALREVVAVVRALLALRRGYGQVSKINIGELTAEATRKKTKGRTRSAGAIRRFDGETSIGDAPR